MWLLNIWTCKLEYFEGQIIPPYAILSHRWETDEVTFQDVMQSRAEGKQGYKKIDACCEQAKQESAWSLSYVWVDTCCIDKSNSAELSEAINSMYNWYQHASICYAYLADVDGGLSIDTKSAWFTRGWTLQELLAPVELRFYSLAWIPIGQRKENEATLSVLTGIQQEAFSNFQPAEFTVSTKMSWTADRRTTRKEDEAYCLLGLFQVNMPMIYGEGERAFRRLQQEILRTTQDATIFCFTTNYLIQHLTNHLTSLRYKRGAMLLADSPARFMHCQGLRLYLYTNAEESRDMHAATISASGITIELRLIPYFRDVYLVSLGYTRHRVEQFGMLIHEIGRSPGIVCRRIAVENHNLVPVSSELSRPYKSRTRKVMLIPGLEYAESLQLDGNIFKDLSRISDKSEAAISTYGFDVIVIHDAKGVEMAEFSSRHKVSLPPSSDLTIAGRPTTRGKLLLQIGTHGLAGVVRLKTPPGDIKFFYFGFSFEYIPICLIVRPESFKSHESWPNLSKINIGIPKLQPWGVWSLASSYDMLHFVELLWARTAEFSLGSEGIELLQMIPGITPNLLSTEYDMIRYIDDKDSTLVGIHIETCVKVERLLWQLDSWRGGDPWSPGPDLI